MKKFLVSCQVTRIFDLEYEVEAIDEDDAIERAEEINIPVNLEDEYPDFYQEEEYSAEFLEDDEEELKDDFD